jgi:alkylated DNA repair dioxygenase AlkB
MLTRRSKAWFADDRSVVYRYSGQVWPPQPLTTELRNLATSLSVTAEEHLNCLLATQYPDGAATVGYHADDEPLFGTNPTIASLSLGTPRVFEIVDRSRAKAPRPDLSLELGDGALIMRGT